MNMSEFATLALEWEKAQRKADELAAVLEAATLEIGKTQTVGNVRVTYSNPRKSYDYDKAAYLSGLVTDDVLETFTEVKEITDWRAICKHLEIDVEGVARGEPSARIKLIG